MFCFCLSRQNVKVPSCYVTQSSTVYACRAISFAGCTDIILVLQKWKIDTGKVQLVWSEGLVWCK